MRNPITLTRTKEEPRRVKNWGPWAKHTENSMAKNQEIENSLMPKGWTDTISK